ncbi:MAG: hypothetical protein IT460_00390 [Planctomycetes bacterium]|nr:hypothetical protein [Planctomycetota bacterium]
MSRLRASAAAFLAAIGLSACCAGGTCIKEPPCKNCENPCALTPIQKSALKAGTHALVGAPVVYSFSEKTYFLFTEQGLTEFEADPTSYDEKGAIRLVKKGKTVRTDVNPGDDFDWAAAAARAVPFTPKAPPAK